MCFTPPPPPVCAGVLGGGRGGNVEHEVHKFTFRNNLHREVSPGPEFDKNYRHGAVGEGHREAVFAYEVRHIDHGQERTTI